MVEPSAHLVNHYGRRASSSISPNPPMDGKTIAIMYDAEFDIIFDLPDPLLVSTNTLYVGDTRISSRNP
ncbi:MAG: hypothetical protein MOB07_25230 [Acidobacteria bacterium]|nr:hypothetical protein [Acidobacteriota bacterium]